MLIFNDIRALDIALRLSADGLRVLFLVVGYGALDMKRKLEILAKDEEYKKKYMDKANVIFRFSHPDPLIALDKSGLNKEAFAKLERLFEKYDVIFLYPMQSFVLDMHNEVFNRVRDILSRFGNEKSLIFVFEE